MTEETQAGTALAVVHVEQTRAQEIDTLIKYALQTKNTEHLGSLIEYAKEAEATNRKAAYDTAFSQLQVNMPHIAKSMHVQAGSMNYDYAPLDLILREIRPVMNKYGFSHHATTSEVMGEKIEKVNGGERVVTTLVAIRVAVVVTHIGGHSEKMEVTMPVDIGNSRMSSAQAMGALLTYARRYALCAALGIQPDGEDWDANKTDSNIRPKLSSDDFAKMKDAIARATTMEDIQLCNQQIHDEDMPTSLYKKAQIGRAHV